MNQITSQTHTKLKESSSTYKTRKNNMEMELGDESAVRETDVEVDDILRKQTLFVSAMKTKVGARNPHTLGSLLDLTHKLRETENRYRKLIKSMEIECESSRHNNHSLNSVSLACSEAPGVSNLSRGQSSNGQQCYPQDFSLARDRGTAFTHRNGNDYSGKLPSNFATSYSNGGGQSVSYDEDHHRGSRTRLDFASAPGLMSNVMTAPREAGQSSTAQAKSDLVLSERRKHRCQMCTYQTDNISHLRRHQCTVHNADKLYHCYVCGMDFSRSERAKAHFLTIHPEIPYHSKIARKRPIIDSSRVNLIVEKVIKPPEVQFHAAEKAPVLKHDSVTMATRKVWEKYCRLVAPANGTGSYHFECVQCEYQGPNIWHLKRHYLDTHVTSGSYSCRVCHYSTGDMQRLISHMTGHGELFCSRCSFSTVELERFRAHLPLCTATGVNELSQCPVCGDEFSDRLSVKSHVSITHQRDYCDQCGCVIYGTATIEEHQRQHHSQSDWNESASEGLSTQQGTDSELGIPDASAGSQTNGSDSNLEKDETEEQLTADGVHQAKIRFGRFSNQVYYCPVEACGFKATWKKSVELHMLNYHGCGNAESENGEAGMSMSEQSAAASGVPPLYGLFNCAFCPNYRTFKYRKSFEKHLLQHGIDYERHPYLVVRCTQSDSLASAADGSTV